MLDFLSKIRLGYVGGNPPKAKSPGGNSLGEFSLSGKSPGASASVGNYPERNQDNLPELRAWYR